ncbi:hypothetical protein CJU89_2763 [Yarrowia sp. B02]|nr:hypothetical protein CJU89_2763 [Yarrowia sp. B02]
MISRLARPLRTQLAQGSRQLQRQTARQYSSGSTKKSSDLPWAATGLLLFVVPTVYIVQSWKKPAKPAPKKEEYEVPALPPIDSTEVSAKVPSADVAALKAKEAAFHKEGDSDKNFDQGALSENQPDLKWKDDGSRDKEIAGKRALATDEDDGHQKQGIKELRDQDLIDDDRLKGTKTDGGAPSKAQGEPHADAPHPTQKTSETVPAKEHKGAQDVEPKAERDAQAEARLAKEKKLDKESDNYVEKEPWADEQVQK